MFLYDYDGTFWKKRKKTHLYLKLTAPRIGAWRKTCARTDAHIQITLAAYLAALDFQHVYTVTGQPERGSLMIFWEQ